MDKNSLPDRLRELRVARGLKQADVAAILNVAQQTYSHYENGKRRPSADMLYKLSGFYGISVDDLLRLSLELDQNEYFDAPDSTRSSQELSDYLNFMNRAENQKRYALLDRYEKEILFYFGKLDIPDKEEMIEFTKVKVRLKENQEGKGDHRPPSSPTFS